MSVIECATCGSAVNADVARCPECGNDPLVKSVLLAGEAERGAQRALAPHPPFSFICPSCSSSMAAGVVVGRAPGVKFEAARDVLGDLGGVTLTSGVFNHSVDAWRCPACGTVVIPGC